MRAAPSGGGPPRSGHLRRFRYVRCMGVRALGSGDEEAALQACRLFGLDGALDASVFLARPEGLLLVAEDGPIIVGWVYGHELIHPDGESTMLLYALDVAVEARGQGHGSALDSVRSACSQARLH